MLRLAYISPNYTTVIKMLAILTAAVGALGVSEREKRSVVCTTCVGQRSASGPGTVHTLCQLPRSSATAELRLPQSARTTERWL